MQKSFLPLVQMGALVCGSISPWRPWAGAEMQCAVVACAREPRWARAWQTAGRATRHEQEPQCASSEYRDATTGLISELQVQLRSANHDESLEHGDGRDGDVRQPRRTRTCPALRSGAPAAGPQLSGAHPHGITIGLSGGGVTMPPIRDRAARAQARPEPVPSYTQAHRMHDDA